MDKFGLLMAKAKAGDADSILTLLERYQPLLNKLSRIEGSFDEDLYQELTATFLGCIASFEM